MPKGNPFGPQGGRWMSKDKLIRLREAQLTYEEIADINYRQTGWRPADARSALSRKFKDWGLPPRHLRHTNLTPWRVRPEHLGNELLRMLRTEGRKQAGRALSDDERVLVSRLHNLLWERGAQMVVGYHPDVGPHLVIRNDADEVFIRPPQRVGIGSLDLGKSDVKLARDALAARVTPEQLENLGRDGAADALRGLMAPVIPPAPVIPAKRRTRADADADTDGRTRTAPARRRAGERR